MKQSFIALEHLVVKYLPDHLKVSLRLPQDQLQRIRDIIDEACSAFLDDLSDSVLSSIDDQRGALLLQYYQRRVIRLADRLAPYFDGNNVADISARKERILYAIAHSLLDLLAAMKADFSRYFDSELQMPYVGVVHLHHQLTVKREQLSAIFLDLHIMDQLPQVFDTWLDDFFAGTSCSFQQAVYAEQLLNAIITRRAQTPNFQRRHIHDIMAFHNMNHPAFVAYLCNRIVQKLDQQRDDHARGKMVRVIVSRIEMARYGEKTAAEPDAPSLKKQLLQWLHIRSFDYENAILYAGPGNDAAEIPRIKLGLTGLELGCFLNAAISAGVIRSNNKKRDIELASRVFATNGQEEMSSDALNTAFYNIKPNAIESVKDKLIAMVNVLIKRTADGKRAVN